MMTLGSERVLFVASVVKHILRGFTSHNPRVIRAIDRSIRKKEMLRLLEILRRDCFCGKEE